MICIRATIAVASFAATLSTDTVVAAPRPQSTAAIEQVLKKHGIPPRDDIVAKVQSASKAISGTSEAHVVVGQVLIPNGTSLADVVCQAEILPDGYFVDAVHCAGIPIWFWHPKCSFGELIPQSNGRKLEWLGRTKLSPSKRRGTIKGIARIGFFDVPKKLRVKATYSPSFVNSAPDARNQREALERRLTEMAEPVVSFDKSTGEFEITRLIEAPVQIELTCSDSKARFLQYIVPGLKETIDLGACELTSAGVSGPLPDIPGEPFDGGRARLERVLDQIAERSGNSIEADKFYGRLSAKLQRSIRFTGDHEREHGDRSAVTVLGIVFQQGADMRLLESSLAVDQAFYVADVNERRSTAKFVYGVVKPGTEVTLALPGFMPFRYTAKGSTDGVEVIENIEFEKVSRRDQGSLQGSVAFPNGLKRFGANLQLSTPPHVSVRGVTAKVKDPVAIYEDGTTSPQSIPVTGSKDRFRFARLQPGCYTLTVWSTPEYAPRQLGIRIPRGEKVRVPKLSLHRVQDAVDVDYVYTSRFARRLLAESNVEKKTLKPNRREMAVQFRKRGSGSGGFGGTGFPGMNTLTWESEAQRGNCVVLTPIRGFLPGQSLQTYHKSSSLADYHRWSILYLGKQEVSEYQKLKTQFASKGIKAFPPMAGQIRSPLRLTKGHCYLLQQPESGFAVVVKVR